MAEVEVSEIFSESLSNIKTSLASLSSESSHHNQVKLSFTPKVLYCDHLSIIVSTTSSPWKQGGSPSLVFENNRWVTSRIMLPREKKDWQLWSANWLERSTLSWNWTLCSEHFIKSHHQRCQKQQNDHGYRGRTVFRDFPHLHFWWLTLVRAPRRVGMRVQQSCQRLFSEATSLMRNNFRVRVVFPARIVHCFALLVF